MPALWPPVKPRFSGKRNRSIPAGIRTTAPQPLSTTMTRRLTCGASCVARLARQRSTSGTSSARQYRTVAKTRGRSGALLAKAHPHAEGGRFGGLVDQHVRQPVRAAAAHQIARLTSYVVKATARDSTG